MVSSFPRGERDNNSRRLWLNRATARNSLLGPIGGCCIYIAQTRDHESLGSMSWHVARPQPSNCLHIG